MALLPKVKLKAVVSFPATILDGTGIDVVKANGTYQFNLAFNDFAPPVTAISDAANQNALLWNKITGTYTLVPMAVFASLPSSSLPLMNGTATVGISTLYSREDHIHPSDTSRAPLASPTFTGDPKAPTPSPGDNDTSIATTAFVTTAIAGGTVAAFNKTVAQVFTASGTYTPTAGMVYCVIECLGSGGGGGGTGNSIASVLSTAGGGGGGSYASVVATAATIGASKTVTIGAVGTGGAAGNNNGVAGGDSSVGTICIGKGGSAGGGNTGSGSGTAGAGGVAGTGALTVVGQAGQYGASSGTFFPSGGGGSSGMGLGYGSRSTISASFPHTGDPGEGYGAGGAGGQTYNAVGTAAGGAGTAGIVLITEFCSV